MKAKCSENPRGHLDVPDLDKASREQNRTLTLKGLEMAEESHPTLLPNLVSKARAT